MVERLILRLELYNPDMGRVIRGMWGFPECSEYIKRITYLNETFPPLHPNVFSVLAAILDEHEKQFPTPDPIWRFR